MGSRFRKAFKYKSDGALFNNNNNNDDEHGAMDEEEQDNLIEELQKHNESMNDIYIWAFTLFPLIATLPFVVHFLSPSSMGAVRLLSLLSITSLCGSAFQMWFVPREGETNRTSLSWSSSSATGNGNVNLRRIPQFDLQIDADGPLSKFIPFLNLGICALLLVSSWGLKQRQDITAEGFWILLLLPTAVFAMVWWARRNMTGVDQGISELGKLKYDYKGA